jgi:predicted Zn-dependent protease
MIKMFVRRLSLIVLVAFTSLSSVAQNERIQLPEIGASAETVISPQFEKEYGEALMRQLRAYNVLMEDPQVEAFFSDMGYRLVANSERPDKHFNFVVIHNDAINAFAAPGGVVALHTGLILAANTESELAGVLAHEVSHVTQLHLARAVENAQQNTIPTMLAMLGLILVGGGSGDAVAGAVMSSQALAAQQQINYTRQNEHEADRLGIQTMAMAGYDPMGMADFFAIMGRVTRSNGEGPPEYLRTHPLTSTRVAEAKNRAEQLEAAPRRDNKDFYLVQARIRALQAEFANEVIVHFNDQLETGEFEPNVVDGNEYGLSIAMMRKGDLEQSRQLLEQLIKRDPTRLAFQLQMAELDQEAHDYDQAIERLRGLHDQFFGNRVIAIHLVRALLATGTAAAGAEASIILRDLMLDNDGDPSLYDLVAQAATLADKQVRAGEAVAEAYFLRGNVQESANQLRRLSRRNDLNYYERARINARLAELEILMTEDPDLRTES